MEFEKAVLLIIAVLVIQAAIHHKSLSLSLMFLPLLNKMFLNVVQFQFQFISPLLYQHVVLVGDGHTPLFWQSKTLLGG